MNNARSRKYDKPKNMRESLKRLVLFSNPYKWPLIISIFCAAFAAIGSIISPQKLSDLVNEITAGLGNGINFDHIKYIAITLLIIYLFSTVFNLLEGIISAHVANKLSYDLRAQMVRKINFLPLSYFDKQETGDTLSRITNDVDLIGQSIDQSLGTIISAVTLFIGSIIMMFATNVVMSITAIISSLLGFGLMALILSKSQKYFIARQKELGRMNAHIEEIYTNHVVVKTYNGVDSATKEFDEINKSLFECNLKSQFLSGLMHPFMGFIGNLSYVSVCIVGAMLVIDNKIDFGVIVAFIVYARLFTNPLTQIAQSMTSMQSALASTERISEFLDEEELEDESEKTVQLNRSKVKGKIEFKDVVFSYNPGTKVIKKFNLSVDNGKKIAIVGPTGAGKTTLVNLLMKFYNLDSGSILIDGVDIKDLKRENVHDLFTMVLQDTWLFNGTLRENISFDNNVSDKKIMDALNTVGLSHFVASLPNGLDTMIQDMDSVSAGEKQLLTIARGLVNNAPLLILDEATSNVDTRTEELVQKAMDKLTKNKTSFIIAHRLSTIKNADLILVIKDGDIVESGKHDELLSKNGYYALLYNSQFEL